MCIIEPAPFLAPYLHQFSTVVQIMYFLVLFRKTCIKFVANLKINAGTATSSGAIWEEFNEQY